MRGSLPGPSKTRAGDLPQSATQVIGFTRGTESCACAGRRWQSRRNVTICSKSWPPQDEARRPVPRSATGRAVTTDQPPHAEASRLASLRSFSASDPATKSFARRGERGGNDPPSGITGERQTSPVRSIAEACSSAAIAGEPATMRNRRPGPGARSGRCRSRSGSCAGSQGSSDSPCPGRSTATVPISSWVAISTGKDAQASRSAPGSWRRTAVSRRSPQRNPRNTVLEGRVHSIARGLSAAQWLTFPIRCACSGGPSQCLARSRSCGA
jgi:hypothetical protein